MKVIFLDIDGVLNSMSGHERIFQALTQEQYCDQYKIGKECLMERGFEKHDAHSIMIAREFDPSCVANFRMILLDVPDVKIVVSSTWRIGYDLENDQVKVLFEEYPDIKERVIGRTKRLFLESDQRKCAQRGEEVKEWLSRHPEVTSYVVIDDDNDMDAVRSNFIRTNTHHGLNWTQAKNCIRILKGEPLYKPSWFAKTCNSCQHFTRLNDSKSCVTGTCQMVFHMFESIKNNNTGELIRFRVGEDFSVTVMEDFTCPMHDPVPWKGPNESSIR